MGTQGYLCCMVRGERGEFILEGDNGLSHPKVEVLHQSLSSSTHTKSSTSHPINDFECIRSHKPTKLLCLKS